MYVPYMYGRQYELLAIRMMLADTERDLGMLMPLVEPVMSQVSGLRRCVEECGEAEQSMGLIVNPHRHQLQTAQARAAWQHEAWRMIDDALHVVPFFRCDQTTGRREIEAFIRRFHGRSAGIAYFGIGLRDADVRWISAHPSVSFHVVDTDHVAEAVWQQMSERLIALKDCFRRLARNADYDGVELFTDRHRTFRGRALGIGDYLCLGREFIDGGSTPGAVAIHAAYKHSRGGDLWVEHFVSDDRTRGEGDTAGKFVQAARKLAAAVRRRPAEFGTNPALREYARLVRAEEFPGLPTNKKLQMVHHMCLMLDVMQERL